MGRDGSLIKANSDLVKGGSALSVNTLVLKLEKGTSVFHSTARREILEGILKGLGSTGIKRLKISDPGGFSM